MRWKLSVQFQGEEGIDAGGVTREWYQARARRPHAGRSRAEFTPCRHSERICTARVRPCRARWRARQPRAASRAACAPRRAALALYAERAAALARARPAEPRAECILGAARR